MSKVYRLTLEFDAVHEGGTKFYQVYSVVQEDGPSRTTGVIGHYGPISKHSRNRFTGQVKVYGTSKGVRELSVSKEKGGYTECRKPAMEIAAYKTQEAVVERLRSMGLKMSAGDQKQMGFRVDLSEMKESAAAEREINEAPVSERRATVGAIATTASENPWVGTW